MLIFSCQCPGVSGGGVCRRWTSTGSGTLTAIVLGGVVCWQGRRRTKSTYNHKAFQDKVWMICTVSVEDIKNRNGTDLTEAQDIKKRWQEYKEELNKKIFTIKIITMA